MNRIKELRDKAGLSQEELAKICGVHQTAVSQWENGRTSPDRQSLVRLSGHFGVSIDSLIGSAGRDSVPVLGSVRAGLPYEAVENILGYEEISQHLSVQGEHFGLVIDGESMLPRICPGDTVIVRRQSDVDSGDVAVVLIGNADATIKQVLKKEKGIILMPFNRSFEPIYFSNDDIKARPVCIIGKVVELRGKM